MTYIEKHRQDLAQETRALAADATNPNVKRTPLMIADNYDRLASLARLPTVFVALAHVSTVSPFAAVRRCSPLSEELLPCR